ncbi:MAG TPA: 50S ribosomal protein L9 [candidate division Zixibacteria bacterium]|nr:50S ribosomal protein L9 [candidate division Zixibacteria bacterium]
MKVILRDDIEGRGKAGDTVEVKSGYARNYLIPRNLAIPASKGNLRAIGEVAKQKDIRDKKRRRDAEKIKDKIESLSLTAEAKVGEDDKLFGSITAQQVTDLLAKEGVTVDRRHVLLEENIKSLGVYTVPVKIEGDVIAHAKVWVVKQPE